MQISPAIHGSEIADDLFEQRSVKPNKTETSFTVCTKFLRAIYVNDNTLANKHAGVIRTNIQVKVIAMTFVVVG